MGLHKPVNHITVATPFNTQSVHKQKLTEATVKLILKKNSGLFYSP